MRFNSYEFIFVFLPVVWIGWKLLFRYGGPKSAAAWLTAASLFFYAWWNWRYAPLLVGSLVVNYVLGRRLVDDPRRRYRSIVLSLGLVWNIGLLGCFKYWNFFIDNVNALAGAGLPLQHIVLPLGISFFTFQKIAFLVDAWRGHVKELRFGEFALFVMFFPQLIAGPIVHHREFIPQLRGAGAFRTDGRTLALGLTLFVVGLFQKCVIADTLAPVADSAFGAAANGATLRLFEAWTGVIAYAFQLFHDFAGYSHMALGLGLMFGLRLPVNFMAPYAAGSLIEFWRRWHMTLSAFLRDYVYIPLGGNRTSRGRHLSSLLITMLLGGLWHGAGWTFVLWGLWHGLALCINHLWRTWRGAGSAPSGRPPLWAHALTFATVTLGWTLFRAPDVMTARSLAGSLFGLHGISTPVSWLPWVSSLAPVVRPRGLWPNIAAEPFVLLMLLVAMFLAWRGPGLLRWFGVTTSDVTPGPPWMESELAPRGAMLSGSRAIIAGLMFALAIAALSRSSPFLYFQF